VLADIVRQFEKGLAVVDTVGDTPSTVTTVSELSAVLAVDFRQQAARA